MTVNQTIGDYELVTDEDSARIKIRYIPDGTDITIHKGTVEDGSGNQVLGSRQSAVGGLSLANNVDSTTDGTIEALSSTYTPAEIERNFAEIDAKLDAILTALGTGGHGLTGD